MIATLVKTMTADEFWDWASLPENADATFELDRGRIIEMPPPGELHGVICWLIAHLLGDYVFQRGNGRVTTNDTGLLVEKDPDTLRGPDVMLFLESLPLEKLSPKYVTEIPTLIVEVLSPSDTLGAVNRRVGQYLRRGVPLVWVVDPPARTVSVYRPGQEVYTVAETEEMTGDNVLPVFRCKVMELFTLPGTTAGEIQKQ
jgi:Uma2 family endonuclease